MTEKKLGFNALVEVIGAQFFDAHKDTAVFSTEETERGLFCFLGIDLHPSKTITLSCAIEEWDIYATCYVKDNSVMMDKCKLP